MQASCSDAGQQVQCACFAGVGATPHAILRLPSLALMQASQCNAHALRLVAPRHKQQTLRLVEAGTRDALRRDLREQGDRRHHHIWQRTIKTAAVLAAIRSIR